MINKKRKLEIIQELSQLQQKIDAVEGKQSMEKSTIEQMLLQSLLHPPTLGSSPNPMRMGLRSLDQIQPQNNDISRNLVTLPTLIQNNVATTTTTTTTTTTSMTQEEECPICKDKVNDDYSTLLCAIHKICRSCLLSWAKYLMQKSKSNLAPDISCPICKCITPSYTIAKILPELESPSLFEPTQDTWLQEALERIEDMENAALLN